MRIELYAPFGTPPKELQPDYLEQDIVDDYIERNGNLGGKIPPSWIALVDILCRIESTPYHWPVGRTAFQKIAYFATETGIPTGLRHERGSYGPYSPETKALLARLVNNGLVSEVRMGRMFSVKKGPTFEDAANAFQSSLIAWQDMTERIADLFARMDTRQAEVAATVHYAARELQNQSGMPPTENDVFEEVQKWKARRKPSIRDAEIAQAIRSLAALGWLDVQGSMDLPLEDELLADS